MKKEAFYISAGKAREYSLNFNIQSFIGRLMFNKKPPKKMDIVILVQVEDI